MKHAIIINGYGTCGKDKFVKLFDKCLPINMEMENISTVDDVKEISKLMGWDGKSKTEKDRQLWVDLKAAWTDYNDGIATGIIDHVYDSESDIFFIHCREPKEIKKFVDNFDEYNDMNANQVMCHTLLIERDGVIPPNNSSDLSVLNYKYDDTIYNNGSLHDFYKAAGEYCSKILAQKL